MGQGDESGFVRVEQVLLVFFGNISPFQVREGLVVKKEELTRISGPIFERVDRAYRRLEEVHGRQGGRLYLEQRDNMSVFPKEWEEPCSL